MECAMSGVILVAVSWERKVCCVSYRLLLTWSLKRQKFGWNGILSPEGNQIQVLDMPVVISYNSKSAPAAKIGVERDVGSFLLFCCWVETD